MPDDADTTSSPPPEPTVPVYDRDESKPRWGAILGTAALTLVVGLGGGFLIGRSTASSGPSSLADAVTKAAQGKLPRGDVVGALRSSGGGGLFGNRGGQGGAAQGAGGGNTQRGRGFGGGLQGTIQSVNGETLTLSTRAGQVKVNLTGNTQIIKGSPGQLSDLVQGEQVSVRPDFGASSSDGSVSAASVQTQPQG